jgi:hypothetical protein
MNLLQFVPIPMVFKIPINTLKKIYDAQTDLKHLSLMGIWTLLESFSYGSYRILNSQL